MAWDVYDVIRVIAQIPADRIDAGMSGAKDIRVGDMGTIVMVLTAPGMRTAYEIESVDHDGSTRWLATLFADEIERVSPVGATQVATARHDASLLLDRTEARRHRQCSRGSTSSCLPRFTVATYVAPTEGGKGA